MTCIAAVADGKSVWMGGDSAGVGGLDLTVRADAKVFHTGPFVMGFTTSFRMGQLLRYAFIPPVQPAALDDEAFMAQGFIDAVRACLKGGGWAKKELEREAGGTFLVGYRGRVYSVYDDYQVGRGVHSFAAVGCGAQVAFGALWATRQSKLGQRARVLVALRAAQEFSAGVRGLFVVIRGAAA